MKIQTHDKGVRSLSGRCSSNASTTQLAMIVRYGHSIIKRVCLRIKLSSENINNDDGPLPELPPIPPIPPPLPPTPPN
ncbi:hypothetical protein DERP_011257 [Dermatophagoides pteronyssinus]|uniref:Uncharacterized protein n=1 Tax=Dermatophagoides pteronyssinus TaxID=6956 RepID=A0ABQ8JCK4_DERPT|nr:hypothetical protein DERP_011257 [Dermatophagoides pteronyssinus]